MSIVSAVITASGSENYKGLDYAATDSVSNAVAMLDGKGEKK